MATTTNLGDRVALQADLDAAPPFDVLVTELKAAGVDVAARRALDRGAGVVFLDNRPLGVGGDGDLDDLVRDVAAMATSRAGVRMRTATMSESKVIVLSGPHPGLPYSKGMRATELMVTGLSPLRAYQIAEEIEERLKQTKATTVTKDELDDLTVEVLSDVAGERYATNYLRWQEIGRLEMPTGGPHRGDHRGREVDHRHVAGRAAGDRPGRRHRRHQGGHAGHVLPGLMPTIYTSSFEADVALREPPPRPADKVIVGFREQTAAVSVGIHALIERAAIEGTSVVIEGAHVTPGFFDLEPYRDRLLGVPVVITVEDEQIHRGHFTARSTDSAARPFGRYLKGFDNIRKIQKYVKSQALSHGVPVITNYNIDQALSSVIDLVVARATEALREGAGRPSAEPVPEEEARR